MGRLGNKPLEDFFFDGLLDLTNEGLAVRSLELVGVELGVSSVSIVQSDFL